ncbi:MAG: hypothetical protein AMJ41_01410, partial [candidate division Zixibacteria bacterium DG_27]
MRAIKNSFSPKTLLGVFPLIMLVISTPALSDYISTGLVADKAVEVVSSDGFGTRLNVRLSGVEIEKAENGGDYEQVKLALPEGELLVATTSEPGKPELPLLTRVLAIPGNCDLAVNVVSASYEEYAGYKIVPAQGPKTKGQFANSTPLQIDEEVYGRDQFYPEKIALTGLPGIMRDLRLVTVSIAPVQFNPRRGILRVYSEIE